jgi:deoxyribodipyrimidine photo-lyase
MRNFKTKNEIFEYIGTINPVKYEQTRNSLNGSVTKLSPYITSGTITLNEIKDLILSKNSVKDSMKLIQELAWRDFFQSVYLSKGDDIFGDLKSDQQNVKSNDLPTAILEANTGIQAIDNAIKDLYTAGYIHNHERMWLASIVCNIAGTKWQTGAKWMYYYLKDGDLASNMLSWQWVAGTFSSKKYYANQENINKYSGFKQFSTFLDRTYEDLVDMEVPIVLQQREHLELDPRLIIPAKYVYESKVSENLVAININTINSGLIQQNTDYILFIDSNRQQDFPINQSRLDFVISMIDMELPECKIVICDSAKKQEICNLYKTATQAKQERMFPTLTDYYPSFFKFWDKASRLV